MPFRIDRPRKAGALFIASAGALLVMASTASATTYTVSTTTDGGTGSLRAAIVAADAAGGSSTINVPAGTYTLTIPSTASTASDVSDDPSAGDLDIDNGASITIAGAGAGQTIIDAARQDRAFAVHQGASLSISDVTIQHAESDDSGADVNSVNAGNGGAIYNDGSLTVSDSALVHDTAFDDGGVIYSDADATSTSVTDSTLSNDSADDPGGAIYVSAGTLSLTGDTLDTDAGEYGGAVYDVGSHASVTVAGTTMSDDSGGYGGGALYLETVGTVSLSNSTFSNDNAPDDPGGAVFLEEAGATTVTGSTFTTDTSPYDYGGGIYDESSGLLTIGGSTFTGDVAGEESGGAVYTDSTDIAVSSSTFTNNAAGNGGALYIDGASGAGSGVPTETITSSTFTGNSAFDGGAVYDESGYVSMTGSTFGENGGYYGGALYYVSGDGLTLANDTMAQNTGLYGGAAIYFDTPSSTDPILLNHDTIADNSDSWGGAVYNPSDANTIENTIIADNTAQSREGGADCYQGADQGESGTFTDAGHNLDSDGTCFGGDASNGAVGDVTNAEPLLSALADNGGPVWTMALQAGSPAIGAGSDCSGTDARGVALPSSCDIGAFQTAATDLSVAGSGPAAGATGAPASYTFTVTNHGPGDDAAVVLTDSLPAGAAYFGASASQGSCTGTSKVTCDLGALDSGSSATVTITVIPTVIGTLTDTATVAGAFTDPVSTNDSATVTTAVKLASAVKPSMYDTSAHSVTKTAATLRSFVDAGNSVTTYWFQYGTSRHFGKATRKRTLAASTAVKKVKVRITHLKAHKTYYFRLVLQNAQGKRTGFTWKFKTH